MNQLTKERTAIAAVALVLLVGGWLTVGFSLPQLLAALVAVPFFCWFVGRGRAAK